MSDGAPSDEASSAELAEDVLERLFRDSWTNAVLAWLLVAVLALVFADSVLDFDRQWMVFVAAAGAIVLVPPVAFREWRVMLPWELLVLALLPILVRGLFGGTVGTFATYFALAALALVVVVELHLFTALEVTHWFAVVLVVMTTLASGAAWAVVRWNFDQFLGTSYLTDNYALMMEFVWVTLAGFAAGVLFDAYFRRRDRWLRRALSRVVPV
ncbi:MULTISPECIES: hypothetical protein [unclassified Halobacterium]|jgi:hypothetical protein|uniref:hypothetical protein n=1 Tax=unclassified Halobacterium TaxID=2668073 RepID=UPI001E3E02ED|nr:MULTISPECIES: hypothetical protein [unclassified Halobacterium]MCD2198976.1 hypothetical protein [Halobacterium sp. KA-4]MCD2202994.1 hypothetical protein [Halobacterium sp. KA-6]